MIAFLCMSWSYFNQSPTDEISTEGLPWWFRWLRIQLQCTRPGFNPWVKKIPWRREWQPTPVFLPRKSHGQSSLVSYSSWGHKESDTTEQLTNTLMDIWMVTDLCHYKQCCVNFLPLAGSSIRWGHGGPVRPDRTAGTRRSWDSGPDSVFRAHTHYPLCPFQGMRWKAQQGIQQNTVLVSQELIFQGSCL